MNLSISPVRSCVHLLMAAALMLVAGGCASHRSATPEATATGEVKAAPARTEAAPVSRPTLRIKAGAETPLTDSKGVIWAADTGFEEGSTIDRPDLKVAGTPTPEIYCSERYSMTAYTFKVPNGAYTLKLHFSEDYDGISAPEGRVFTYAVKDGPASGKLVKEVKDFSPWKAAGAQFKAYVDTVHVNVTSGQVTITFTPQVENPQINAVEIIPE